MYLKVKWWTFFKNIYMWWEGLSTAGRMPKQLGTGQWLGVWESCCPSWEGSNSGWGPCMCWKWTPPPTTISDTISASIAFKICRASEIVNNFGMFQENSIETCILSRVKQITSPGWMHETSAQTWCTGKTQRNRVEREMGGGIGMGSTCNSMADSCQCMTKPTTIL